MTEDGFLLLTALPLLCELIIDVDEVPDQPFELFCKHKGAFCIVPE